MYYETYGSGTPLLALHGFMLDHRVLTGCLEPIFAGRPGYLRIYPDLPGMGRTPAAPDDRPANADEMLDLLLAFVDQTIQGPFLLAGNSYGGYLARGLVRRRPEQVAGLLLICPVVYAQKARRTVPAHRVLYQDKELLATLTAKEAADFQEYAVVQSRYTWERMQRDVLSGQALADEAFLSRYGERGYGFSFDVDPLPAPFDKPSLFLAGRQDSIVGHEDLATILGSYPRASLAVLDRAGHNLEFEQPALFGALVGEWLDRVEESLYF